MNKFILLFTTIVALTIDLCFFHYNPNLSVLAFILILNACYLLIFKESFRIGLNIETFISIANTAISASYFIFNQKELREINFWVILILSFAQMLIIFKKSKYEWHNLGFVPDVFRIIFTKSFKFVSKYFYALQETVTDLFVKNISEKSNVRKVLLGLLMVLPVLIIVIILLSSSDQVFSNLIKNFTDLFMFIELNTLMYHSILIFAMSLPIFSIVYYLASHQNTELVVKEEDATVNKTGIMLNINDNNTDESLIKKTIENPIENFPVSTVKKVEHPTTEAKSELAKSKLVKAGIDPIMFITALLAIDFIYVMFVVIQFSYLFGSNDNLPFGLNYSEYARKGFFELVIVTIINLSIFLFGTYFVSTDGDEKNILSQGLKFLNILMLFCTFVMLFSAHMRMNLYQEIYGFTFLRLFTHFFMLFICILLLLSLFRIFKRTFKISAAYIVVTMCFCVIINYINIDGMIARKYIERFETGLSVDFYHLTSLSQDSDIYILDIFTKLQKDETLPRKTAFEKTIFINTMTAHLKSSNKNCQEELSHWQSINLGKYIFNKKYKDVK